MLTKLLSTAVAAVLVAAVSGASAQVDPASVWRAWTTADLEFAHKLVSENHPAAAPELGDDAFVANLKSAYATARARAAEVDTYDGYVATMAGFANSFGDKHIWSRPHYLPMVVQWTGLVVAKRGPSWTVVEEDPVKDRPPLVGSRLLSCDGTSVDELAQRNLGAFRAVWSIEAQRVGAAPWLLVNDGNPFVTPPKACVFDQQGQRRTVELAWKPALRGSLAARLAKAAPVGAAGFGVRKFDGGWWIGVQQLGDRALPVIEEVKANAAAIRSAPLVVVDVRGNGGGDSTIGRALAAALLGSSLQREGSASGAANALGCSSLWRASPGNVATLESYKVIIGARNGPQAVKNYADQATALAAAVGAGKAFAGDVAGCRAALAKAASARSPLAPRFETALKGRVILLTDRACFSSCLMMTEDFLELGAVHAGEATDAATRYMEVREEKTPSGMSVFSTLQKASLTAPAQIGPYLPAVAYEGDISDTAALEAWVTRTFAAAGGRAAP